MTRIVPLAPPYAADVQSRFDQVMPPGASPLLLFRIMAKSPRGWKKLAGGSLLDPGPLTLRQREIVIDRTCALLDCEYEWGVHIAFFARAANLTSIETNAIVRGDAHAACWSAAERALIEASDALFKNNKLSTTEFAALRLYFDEEQVIEIIQICGFYRTISYLVGSFDLPLEDYSPRFDDFLAS